ncbi:DUF3617 domain-containing protein [Novosphingobium sp. PASSN1]|jgi:hypothetical protein|uniref:DUF3617 domain-containing protein n=1 Tax=Novosphingobium sp. PASSN1 TaxID=2015561 RepID=UPI000BD41B9B|nr:DUF3617 domain-containing protein [Novosphingobium sp. PASSN1]OYU36706.1 MAG: hypothetical protein CFE35_05455 [Novosphingobium sp. PASSN1]
MKPATGIKLAAAGFALCVLASCSDNSADKDNNGVIDSKERAAEMDYDAFIPMKAGQWETKFVFTDIDVPTLGKAEKQQIMDEVAKSASSRSCLTEAEAKKPGADFFGGNGAEKCVYKAFDVSGQNVRLKLSCGMEGMGSVDMELAGVMGETEFNYDSKVDVRLPMIGKVKMQGKATGKYAGACPAA